MPSDSARLLLVRLQFEPPTAMTARIVVAAHLLICLPGCVSGPADVAVADAVELTRAEPHAPVQASIDVQHYAIDIELRPAERAIAAVCTLRFHAQGRTLDQVSLDLAGLTVERVTDGAGAELGFVHADDELVVMLAEPLAPGDVAEIRVEYGGSPRKGLWFAGDAGGAPTHVFTQGECEDAHWWFPCVDEPGDRATTELCVTMPAHWTSVAAGELIESVTTAGTRRDRWRMPTPHPTYLTTLVAGAFEEHRTEWDGIPLRFLAPAQWAGRLESSLAATAAALEFLSEVTGRRYPYSKYSQACVQNFPFGGMENISATTLAVEALSDERGRRDSDPTELVVHEAAHQWFGDLLTCADWSHVWLNEGFATYLTMLFAERTLGQDAFRTAVRDALDEYTAGDRGANRRPLVWSVYKDPLDLFFGGHTYQGGAVRLHHLRFVLGDEAFFRGLRIYVGENAGRGVVTDDLAAAMEEASGVNLGPFFEQWFYSPGYPEFETRWRYDAGRQRVLLSVNQVQALERGTPAAFSMPVLVEVKTATGTSSHRLAIDQRRHLFEIPSETEPEWVRFDKYGWIPCRHSTEKELSEWLAIAASDDDVNGRRDAVRALGAALADEGSRADVLAPLLSILAGDSSAAVRVAAAAELAQGGAGCIEPLAESARSDAAATVRVAALGSLEAFGRRAAVRGTRKQREALTAIANEVFEARFSWDTMGAAAGLVAAVYGDKAFEWIVGVITLESPNGELRANLAAQLARLDDPRVPGVLLDLALQESEPPLARIAAARGLARFARGSRRARDELTKLLSTANGKLRQETVQLLAALMDEEDPELTQALSAHYESSVSPRERRAIEASFAKR